MERTWARFFVLVTTSIVGMAMLGIAAFFAAYPFSGYGRLTLDEWVILVVPALVGAVVGFVSMPLIVEVLADAHLRKSIPVVYGLSIIPTVLWASFFPWGFGITAALPAFLSVILVSGWCTNWYGIRARTHHCEHCGYDLSGCKDPGCPECGCGRENTGNEPRP